MLDDLLIRYAEQFGENFPMFIVRGTPEEEIAETLLQCLRDGVPYEYEEPDPTKSLY